MLLISDLQLITGLAIIICGFVQLRCGISAYHFQRVAQLAWFSSVTHLCCLTFLRSYLHMSKTAQYWRVPGIVILVIMLITAQAFITHFAFNDAEAMLVSRPRPQDYARCFLSHHEILPDPKREELATWAELEFTTNIQRVICAAVLLGFGTLNRLWRFYDWPTAQYLLFHDWIGKKAAAQLERLFLWTESDRPSLWWPTVLVYCPVLTLALGLRVLSDILTSKAFEVS